MQHETQAKAKLLINCANQYVPAVNLTKAQIDGYMQDLASVPAAVVDAALRAHRRDPQRGRFFPSVADIFSCIPANQGAQHLPADSAWGVVLTSMDEADTVLMTEQMTQARAVAWPVWEAGDKIGARMAFKGAYEQLTRNAPPPVWQVSLGHDADRREQVIQDAVSRGMLTSQQAARYLTATKGEDNGHIVGLLTGKVSKMPLTDETRKRLAEMKAALASREPKQKTEPDQEKKRLDEERLAACRAGRA